MNKEKKPQITQASIDIQSLLSETQKVIVWQDRLMRNLVIALFARGHIILEWVPGLAKTLAIETLWKVIGVDVSRVQFTPDLLPSDLVGTQIWNQAKGEFQTQKGPIFSHLVLADEINRAPAKVQSALLEAMAERQVTIGDETYELEEPFVVMATQNPVEQDGTYDLPEAQLDRFLLKTRLWYPTSEEEIEIMKRFWWWIPDVWLVEVISRARLLEIQWVADEIHVSDSMYEYMMRIVAATREPKKFWCDRLVPYIQFGASPRASIALMKCAKVIALMHERLFVIPEDVQEIAQDVLQHRLILSFDAAADGISVEEIIQEIITKIPILD